MVEHLNELIVQTVTSKTPLTQFTVALPGCAHLIAVGDSLSKSLGRGRNIARETPTGVVFGRGFLQLATVVEHNRTRYGHGIEDLVQGIAPQVGVIAQR